MAKKQRRKTAFVPRLLVPAAAIVSVVPACALASCSGNVSTGSESSGFTVAAVAYPAYEAGVDAPPDSPVFGVAAVAYPAYEAGTGNG